MMTVKIFKVSRIESRMGHGFSVVIGKRSVDIIRGSKGDYPPLNIRSRGRLMISSRRVIGFSSLDSLQLTLRQLATRPKLRVMDILGFTLLGRRSEEHTSELKSLMRIAYAVFGLKEQPRVSVAFRLRYDES